MRQPGWSLVVRLERATRETRFGSSEKARAAPRESAPPAQVPDQSGQRGQQDGDGGDVVGRDGHRQKILKTRNRTIILLCVRCGRLPSGRMAPLVGRLANPGPISRLAVQHMMTSGLAAPADLRGSATGGPADCETNIPGARFNEYGFGHWSAGNEGFAFRFSKALRDD